MVKDNTGCRGCIESHAAGERFDSRVDAPVCDRLHDPSHRLGAARGHRARFLSTR